MSYRVSSAGGTDKEGLKNHPNPLKGKRNTTPKGELNYFCHLKHSKF